MAVFIIADIAQAHDGSLGILHSYIDAITRTGIDAIKFQTHIAEAESSIYEQFRYNFSYIDKTRYDYWKRMEFSLEQWVNIKKHCNDVGLEFLSSAFSCAAVDLLEKLGVHKYKIGSGEVTNYLMLDKIAKTGKEIILSSGMSSYQELDETVRYLSSYNNKISILQCTTRYPTEPEDIGLNIISEMKSRYNLPTGLSDHSGTIYPALAAVTLGAEIIEVHAVFDKNLFGPDATSSLTIRELEQLVKGIKFLEKSLNKKIDKNDYTKFIKLKRYFGKSLSINKDVRTGHVIKVDDLESKKPAGYGISPKMYKSIIGKKINKELKCWNFINSEDLSE